MELLDEIGNMPLPPDITEKLKDGEFHHITELNAIRNVPREQLDSVLHHMAEEEEIEIKLSRIRLSKQQ